jgi:serine/threonine protein kinase
MSIDSKSVDVVDEDDNDDARIEGTTAFLPPEVVLGGIPSKSADSWALGCVFFQCLAGRPPLLDTNEASTRQRIVTFELSSSEAADDDFFLERSGTSSFTQLSKHLIRRLLNKIPSERPNMSNIAMDEFFQGKDIFSLHTKPSYRLDAGKVAPSPDARWSRRQFSSIWAPQPQAYVISNAKTVRTSYVDRFNAPIIERGEREAYFLSTGHKMLTKVSER